MQLGGAHPQHHLLEHAEGTIIAIGVDRTACMAQFGRKTYKLLIGRGGAFQLKISETLAATTLTLRKERMPQHNDSHTLMDADADPR